MSRDTDVAVIGAGCRFPDARTPQEFWANLERGHVSTRDQSDRLLADGASAAALRVPGFVPVAATVPDADRFASEFFGYTPADADAIDPVQRLFLEVCWEALESAGHPPRADGPVVGVFASGGPSPYSLALQAARLREHGIAGVANDLELAMGGSVDFMASRVAYKLGLRGPAVAVQTACSSSLTAVHYAVLSLLAGECDLALAGGAALSDPLIGYQYTPGGIMSEDGYCRPFDEKSTGTAAGAGVGVVALRRLADALADGDAVLAVIRGSAVGNDGAARSGFTAPSPSGVAAVVAAALRVAWVAPEAVRYVEAHGSGTALGDSLELRGLTEGFAAVDRKRVDGRRPRGYCALGSVKANIGHAGWAAGIAGFVNAVHVAGSGRVPPHPLFEHPRDPAAFAESPFFIARTPVSVGGDGDWSVLVNSMGLGGTNASVVLGPPPPPTRPPAPVRDVLRLVLSARTRGELDQLCRLVADATEASGVCLADVSYTLRVGRRSFDERRVVTAPAGRLAATLRQPRPPAARTLRSPARDALLVAPADVPGAAGSLLARLGEAFKGRARVVNGPLEEIPPDRFAVLLGHGRSGPGRHVLPVDAGGDADPDQLDEALTTAWLHGVEVDWDVMGGGCGRRVQLPTYPFQRRRHWALDRVGRVTAEPPAPSASSTATAPVEASLLALWRELLGHTALGPDDEFGTLGGTSLLGVRMALEIQQRFGVLVNLHRAGGSRTTIRRLAEIVHAARGTGAHVPDEVADGDRELIDADLRAPLGERSASAASGTDVLLTGATGFLGAFLLHHLLHAIEGPVSCLVRADGEEAARQRLRDAAIRYALPEPDERRVRIVTGDLRDVERLGDGGPPLRIGHVLHCAARVVFTEPYRVLRADNVLPVIALLRWMRRHGVRDFTFVSSLAATGRAHGLVHETRDQPLDPEQGGYGVGKWVAERLLERAESEELRVRVFRPGLLLGSTSTGGCNPKDLIWRLLASGVAVGAHPLDDRALPMAPVDVVARALVDLALRPASAGHVYHLVDETAVSPRRLFEMLGEAGLPTTPVSPAEWLRIVAERALASGHEVLASMALYEREGHAAGERSVQADAWQPWLRGHGHDAAPTGARLRAALTHLCRTNDAYAALLAPTAACRDGKVEAQ